jgi:hypothetical protein
MALASSNAARMIFVAVTFSLLSGFAIASASSGADPRSTDSSHAHDWEIGKFIPRERFVFTLEKFVEKKISSRRSVDHNAVAQC